MAERALTTEISREWEGGLLKSVMVEITRLNDFIAYKGLTREYSLWVAYRLQRTGSVAEAEPHG